MSVRLHSERCSDGRVFSVILFLFIWPVFWTVPCGQLYRRTELNVCLTSYLWSRVFFLSFFRLFCFLVLIVWEGDTFEWPRIPSPLTEREGSLLDLREPAPVLCFDLRSIGPYPQDEGKFSPVHPMIAYAGVEVRLNSFMTSEMYGIELSASRPGCFATEKSGPC